MTCGLASRSSLLEVDFSFSPFFSLSGAANRLSTPLAGRNVIVRATSKFFANGSLMVGYACCFFERARGSLGPHYPDNFNRETTSFPSICIPIY